MLNSSKIYSQKTQRKNPKWILIFIKRTRNNFIVKNTMYRKLCILQNVTLLPLSYKKQKPNICSVWFRKNPQNFPWKSCWWWEKADIECTALHKNTDSASFFQNKAKRKRIIPTANRPPVRSGKHWAEPFIRGIYLWILIIKPIKHKSHIWR